MPDILPVVYTHIVRAYDAHLLTTLKECIRPLGLYILFGTLYTSGPHEHIQQ